MPGQLGEACSFRNWLPVSGEVLALPTLFPQARVAPELLLTVSRHLFANREVQTNRWRLRLKQGTIRKYEIV